MFFLFISMAISQLETRHIVNIINRILMLLRILAAQSHGIVYSSGKSCKDPGTPLKGNKRGNLQVGQTLHFSCNQCYQLRGSGTRICQSDLTWSGSQPRCSRKFHFLNGAVS